MSVVHAGDRISDRIFHSRLNPCVAVTAVHVPNLLLIAPSAPISRSRLAVSSLKSVRGRSSSGSRSSSMMPAFV